MLSEDPIYEKLNETNNAQDFITETVSIFEDAVDHLINRVFRKTDFVVKSVVESLFETSGPLSDLAIRLKVLLGLGVINHQVFEDIQAFSTSLVDVSKAIASSLSNALVMAAIT